MEKAGIKHGAMTSGHSAEEDSIKMSKAAEFYASFLRSVRILFHDVKTINKSDIDLISGKVRTAWEEAHYNRRFLMRVLHSADHEADKNHLHAHAMRTAIIAVIIGGSMKLPHHRLNDLGFAALLHDIGMFKLPPEFFTKNKMDFTVEEKRLLFVHPIHGYKQLQQLHFSPDACLAVLEHHERENGSGYPRKLTGDRISLLGKIIAVACSYESITAKRPHKKTRNHYAAMSELFENKERRYDDAVIRALVHSFSFYPVGMFVLLSDGRKGQVVDVYPEHPQRPVVQLLGPQHTGKETTINTLHHDISIVRLLSDEEVELEKAS